MEPDRDSRCGNPKKRRRLYSNMRKNDSDSEDEGLDSSRSSAVSPSQHIVMALDDITKTLVNFERRFENIEKDIKTIKARHNTSSSSAGETPQRAKVTVPLVRIMDICGKII